MHIPYYKAEPSSMQVLTEMRAAALEKAPQPLDRCNSIATTVPYAACAYAVTGTPKARPSKRVELNFICLSTLDHHAWYNHVGIFCRLLHLLVHLNWNWLVLERLFLLPRKLCHQQGPKLQQLPDLVLWQQFPKLLSRQRKALARREVCF